MPCASAGRSRMPAATAAARLKRHFWNMPCASAGRSGTPTATAAARPKVSFFDDAVRQRWPLRHANSNRCCPPQSGTFGTCRGPAPAAQACQQQPLLPAPVAALLEHAVPQACQHQPLLPAPKAALLEHAVRLRWPLRHASSNRCGPPPKRHFWNMPCASAGRAGPPQKRHFWNMPCASAGRSGMPTATAAARPRSGEHAVRQRWPLRHANSNRGCPPQKRHF